jgi:hypothetical protein
MDVNSQTDMFAELEMFDEGAAHEFPTVDEEAFHTDVGGAAGVLAGDHAEGPALQVLKRMRHDVEEKVCTSALTSNGASLVPTSQPFPVRKVRNNVRNRKRVAVVKETVDELREELERQGAMEPVAPEVVAAGGRRLDMAAPKAKILGAALHQLIHLQAENERLRQLALAKNTTPLSLVMPPPGVSSACMEQTNFVSWAFQHSGVPTCIILPHRDVIIACNRSFRDLLGLAADCGTGETCCLPSGEHVGWNDIVHPDHYTTVDQAQVFLDLLLRQHKNNDDAELAGLSGIPCLEVTEVNRAGCKRYRKRSECANNIGTIVEHPLRVVFEDSRGGLDVSGEEGGGGGGRSPFWDRLAVETDVGSRSDDKEDARNDLESFVTCMSDFKIAQVEECGGGKVIRGDLIGGEVDCDPRRRVTAVLVSLLPVGASAWRKEEG